MELTHSILAPLVILSEGEIYFLKTIVPALLLFPWILTIAFIVIRWILKWLASLLPKSKPLMEITEPRTKAGFVFVEEQTPKLKELELLAKSDPRLAIFGLSQFVRSVNIGKGFERYSLEYYLKETGKKWYKPWLNVLSDDTKTILKKPDDLFFSILKAAYQTENPNESLALELIAQVRSLKTKNKGSTK